MGNWLNVNQTSLLSGFWNRFSVSSLAAGAPLGKGPVLGGEVYGIDDEVKTRHSRSFKGTVTVQQFQHMRWKRKLKSLLRNSQLVVICQLGCCLLLNCDMRSELQARWLIS